MGHGSMVRTFVLVGYHRYHPTLPIGEARWAVLLNPEPGGHVDWARPTTGRSQTPRV